MKKLINTLICSLALWACSPKTAGPEAGASPAPPASSTPPPNQGTVAGGGGVGIQGRPLESYKLDWSKHQELDKRVMDIIIRTSKASKKLAGDLAHVKMQRIWYSVPTQLDQIPVDRLGVYFSIDQEAIQNFDEVWLNDLIFGKQSLDDQTTLCVHELAVGVYILNRANDLDRCLAAAGYDRLKQTKDADYDGKSAKCYDRYPLGDVPDPLNLGHQIDLGDDDYKAIRFLSTKLMSGDIETDEEIEKELTSKGYKLY